MIPLFKNKIIWLFLVILLCHGFFLIMNGICWDDYVLIPQLLSGNYNEVISIYSESGYILGGPAYLHIAYSFLFGSNLVFGYRFFAFIWIVLSGILVYKIFKKLKFKDLDSFFIASLASIYPAFKAAFIAIHAHYIFCYFVFILGVYIFVYKVKNNEFSLGLSQLFWRGLSILLFVLSFFTSSILVFYCGVLFFIITKDMIGRNSIKIMISSLFKYLDYWIIPMLFFFVEKTYFPAYGFYANQNELQFASTGKLLRVFAAFWKGIYVAIRASLSIINIPLFISIPAFVFFACYLFYRLIKEAIDSKEISNKLITYVFSWMLLILAIFPYAAVGKFPDSSYASRHLLLVGLPLALILFCFIRFIEKELQLGIKAVNIMFISLILLFSYVGIENYINWQYRFIKDESIMLQLKEMPYSKKYSTFFIENDTNKASSSIETAIYNYSYYEWSGIFNKVWKGEKWIGYDRDSVEENRFLKDRKCFIHRYNLADYDPSGPIADMKIFYPNKNKLITQRIKTIDVSKYYYFKWIKKDKLEGFLKSLVNVEITESQ
ncbi:hypothetical protein A2276_06010 [candidate division WOR-1 bacterium RIFOXYA12_FULL_43_27]|uniref:Glycosyltransferase RgtA/B/C/D-like domain-containing protein n=1 Tax=candidate division WOR-1 bacterium RIFOXYC2_FULL_46_14 TaxID=1802587 RepID=A0A1F4U3I2_UNCSA|nr:MAG: hypothetical protein A2276_06010 [candidate division WOR-1 bacterium RIFOXYA12_FULL_43_27]OGC20213.1 MAG: hypothetical protein A2292_04010 [candidate division WOR-1 bacterium RIFOXYB2_FULL_46_45]OGC32049.1 MAG: hypothetical protein A2232_07435 [candidate division WOR-1 bacterium RIFOXYA2_FULL_46_56]OGC39451.1 MAG: hypothetical protein A2438_07800 [candidate division WOR-1 bacterium RIFOXYC2_FULL_46_14]